MYDYGSSALLAECSCQQSNLPLVLMVLAVFGGLKCVQFLRNHDLKKGQRIAGGLGSALVTICAVGFLLKPPSGTCTCSPVQERSNTATESASPCRSAFRVLYVHGSSRCRTCVEIEQRADLLIHTRFKEKITSGVLCWLEEDWDAPNATDFRKAFNLAQPSLVLAEYDGDTLKRYNVLDQAWEYVHEPGHRLEDYIDDEVQRFMNKEKEK